MPPVTRALIQLRLICRAWCRDVVGDEALDEVIAVVISLVPPQHDRLVGFAASVLEQMRMELLSEVAGRRAPGRSGWWLTAVLRCTNSLAS